MFVLALLAYLSLSMATCPPSLDVSLDMESRTVKSEGREYRRADILVFIPVTTDQVISLPSLREEFTVEEAWKDHHRVRISVRNVTFQKVEGASLVQRGNVVEDSIEARRIISRTPLIFEPIHLFPTDMRDGYIVIKLPPIGPGESLEVSYLVRGPKVEKPRVVGGEVTKTKKVYMLVAKYSVLFGFGRTRTEDINLRNAREVLEGLRSAGLRPLVKVVGIADGRTSDPKRNREVAERRARFVATEILGSRFACYIRRGFARETTGSSP